MNLISPPHAGDLDRGDFDVEALLRFGIPARFHPLCKSSAIPAGLQRLDWMTNHNGPIACAFGLGADMLACQALAAVFISNRARVAEEPYSLLVAGPPPGRVHVGIVRAVPADLVEQLYHPSSPLNGVRPSAGPDEPAGIEVGIGALAILGLRSPQALLTHFPRVDMCVRRRALEGLPTFLAFGVDDGTTADALGGIRWTRIDT